MSAIFNALPGMDVPAGAISKNFTRMWADVSAKGGVAPASDGARAMQVNFVLHLGFGTTPEDAVAQFRTAVSFSKRYPCRVVVLCPHTDGEDTAPEIRAKIYGECHLGKSKGDTRCCEFVILSYPLCVRQFLESQVSVCLSTDLPLYYWAHHFTSTTRLADYQYLLGRSKRVLIDTALVPADTATFAWPRPEAVRDLVYARLLPVRQSIGQFLGSYAPDVITAGLTGLTLVHEKAYAAEARVLRDWLGQRLAACGLTLDANALKLEEREGGCSFALTFNYNNGHQFSWRGELAHGGGYFDADFGGGRTTLPTAVSLLGPEAALGEAMFF